MNRRHLSKKAKFNNRRRSLRLNKQRGGNLINIKLFDHLDRETSVQISNDATVLQLKEKIAETHKIDVNNIQLFLNNELKNDNLLTKYGLKDMSELSLVIFDENETEEDSEDYDN